MDWIPLYRSLSGHPKAKKLARLTDSTIPCIVGHLSLLWSWAVDYAPDGNLSRFESAEVADACMWDVDDADAFCAALRDAGFVDDDGTLHDWPDYTGSFVAKRAANAERMRRARAGNEERASTVRERVSHVQPADESRALLEGSGSKGSKGQEELEPNPLARDELGHADVEAPDEGTAGGQRARGLIEAAPVASTPRPPAASTRLRGRQTDPPGFADFYAAFPVHVGRGQAVRAFRAATKKADPDVVIAGAVRFAADPNLPTDASKIPYPATWLNGERWLDEALPARTEGTELDQWMAEARNG